MTAKEKPSYLLFNETDGIYASSDAFRTKAEADAFAKKFRERFAAQGYYLTAQGERIPPSDIRLRVVPAQS